MAIYIVNIFIILLAALLKTKNYIFLSRKRISGNEIAMLFIFVSFSLIMGSRSYNVGVDTSPYTRIYTIIANSGSYFDAINNAPLTAPIYVLLCWLVSRVSSDPQLWIFVSAIALNFALIRFIKKTSSDASTSAFVWIGLTLFYCSMNGNRQCISLTIALNAIYYLTQDLKNKKGWILFVISVGIHTTAIFFGLAILGIKLADKIQDSKILFFISTIFSAVLAIGYSSGVKLFLHFFPRYSLYTSGESKYSIFVGNGGGRIVLLYIFLFCIVILWVSKVTKKGTDKDSFNQHMLPAVIFGSVFGIINCRNELINRMLWYYLALYISFVPSVILKFRKEKMLIRWGIIAVLVAYSFISVLENQNGVMPYSFFWS